jgi:RNA polymerase nonessential primary-like sigma factor
LGLGLEVADLIAAGNIGLIKAVDHFVPNRTAKFSTYASWWIKREIRDGLTKAGSTVRIPAHLYQKARDLQETECELARELDRDPTEQEISERSGLTEKQIEHRRRSMRTRNSVSLDAPISDGPPPHNATSLSDTLADPTTVSTSDVMINGELHQLIHAILGDERAVESLPVSLRSSIAAYRSRFLVQELDVIKKRFGLGSIGATSQTLGEIAIEYQVTGERIRQLQVQALAKFKKVIERIDQQRNPTLEALGVANATLEVVRESRTKRLKG